ncbi:MAG: histidine kinase, partial [Planctomycetes bacterium]|nr:histidine kinase [Planctomycetota bacterium]
ADDETPPPEAASNDGTPTPAPAAATSIAKKPRPADPGGWSMLDSVVVLIAMGVIALSILGGFWLLGR